MGSEVASPSIRQDALDAAAVAGSVETIAMLLKSGAEATGGIARAAAKSGHSRILAALIEARAPVDGHDALDWQPLHFAAYNGHAAVAMELLKHRASLEARNG